MNVGMEQKLMDRLLLAEQSHQMSTAQPTQPQQAAAAPAAAPAPAPAPKREQPAGVKEETAANKQKQAVAAAPKKTESAKADVLVTVTGISGYLGSHVARQLLAQGYKVRGTVRALEKELAREHAAAKKNEAKASSPKRRRGVVSAAAARLEEVRTTFPTVELFQCNLVGGAAAFEKAFVGASFVIHTACPHGTRAKDPEAEMVRPAVDGVKAVMRAARAARVKRVVLTSSCGAVQSNRVPSPRDHEWTEEDWNDDSTLSTAPYRYAKTLAERMAWQCTGDAATPQKGKAKSFAPAVELVSICPAMVLGPPIYKLFKEGLSVRYMSCILQGRFRTGAPGGPCFGIVDVRDVAAAHIKAMAAVAVKAQSDDVGAHRYIMSSATGVASMEIVECIRSAESLEECLWLPGCLPDNQVIETSYRPRYSTAKAREELSVTIRPWQETVKDMATALISLGIVKPPGATANDPYTPDMSKVPGAQGKAVARPGKAQQASPERSSSSAKAAATAKAAAAVAGGATAGGQGSSRAAGVTAAVGGAAVASSTAAAGASAASSASTGRTVYYWKQEEIDRLVAIVKEEGMGNWERKAMLLGTNRSASSVEQKYHVIGRSVGDGAGTFSTAATVAVADSDGGGGTGPGAAAGASIGGSGRPIAKVGKWTEEEMGRLVTIVRQKGLGDWDQKALALGTGRTSGAVEQKYYVITREVAHTRPVGVAGYTPGGATYR